MPRTLTALVAIFAFCCLGFTQQNWTVSWKFETQKISDDVAELRAAGQTILRWRGQDAISQVQQLAEKLNQLLWQGIKPEAIAVVQVQGGFNITVNNEPVLTVTHQVARIANSDTKALAEQWAQNLREVFGWRWLATPLTELVIAVGENATVQLFGTAEGSLQVEAIPPELLKLKVGTDSRSIVVTGVDAGVGVLRIVKGMAGIRLPFRVLYRAAAWKDKPVAWVRGAQISASMVHEAVENAVMRTLDVRLGARWTLLPANDSVNFFPANTTSQWRIQAMGDQFLPLDEVVNIPLQSFPQSLGEADLLVISNDPETFQDFRVLCRGLLQPSQTMRFMVHHRNGMSRPAWLVFEFHNTEDSWVPLIVRFGYGNPQESEMRCGHDATASYLRSLLHDSAIRIYLPPQSIYRLLRFGLKPRDTASTLVEARLEEVAGVGYRVTALPIAPSKTELLTGTLLVEALTGASDPPPYPKPIQNIEETHVAGKNWNFISVGRFGLKHPIKGRVLHGNYGVLYRVTVKFVNPTNRSWRAQIVVEPAGGVVRGAFLVDGRLVELPLLRPHDEHVIHDFTLQPNQTRTVTVMTIPSAGSFYPIQIVARTQ
ncbi:MAG: hypothetical protein N3B10_00160 [Armatimonadetes bacterium]|nr:hypothetical protein [Armatimonadota bacterium]MCX7966882.1 hypothetical protein [Armatimonadota bacterium]MDW8141840.1 hypothetical protein [Armatimonadota bacterium]